MKEVLNENYWRDKGIIFLGEIDDESAERTVKEMIWMSKQGLSSISILMNGPGGVVSAGYYIHDVIQSLKNKGIIVKTVCCGVCASMDAFILASGSPGHRICLPNAEVMIHQPLGGMQGQASDMRIQWEHMQRTKERYELLLAHYCGRNVEEITAATDRDNYMSAEEARNFGIIDRIENLNEILED